jgi:hypothetical protein
LTPGTTQRKAEACNYDEIACVRLTFDSHVPRHALARLGQMVFAQIPIALRRQTRHVLASLTGFTQANVWPTRKRHRSVSHVASVPQVTRRKSTANQRLPAQGACNLSLRSKIRRFVGPLTARRPFPSLAFPHMPFTHAHRRKPAHNGPVRLYGVHSATHRRTESLRRWYPTTLGSIRCRQDASQYPLYRTPATARAPRIRQLASGD